LQQADSRDNNRGEPRASRDRRRGWGPGATLTERIVVTNQRRKRERAVVGAGGGAPAQSKKMM